MARTRIEQHVIKPFIGNPYLRYGQMLFLWSYFYQVGGMLAAKHSANLDAFWYAFRGAYGPSGAVKKFFTDLAERCKADFLNDSMKFWDYIIADISRRMNYKGDPNGFFLQRGMMKLSPDTALKLALQYADYGAALGALHPHIIKKMFEETYTKVAKEKWEDAYAHGLDIPSEQDIMSYDEVEKEENEMFMDYCRGCFPRLSDKVCKPLEKGIN